MLKKWIERIFRRQELEALAQEVGEKEEKIWLLTTGDSMKLDQHERRMILAAIELDPFRAQVELPATRAHVRIIWRKLREKIQLSIKKEDRPRLAKKVDEEIVPIPENPNPVKE